MYRTRDRNRQKPVDSRKLRVAVLAAVLSAGCALDGGQRPSKLSMRTERIDRPRPESCPGTPIEGPAGDLGATPFSSADEVRARVGTTVWFAGSGWTGGWDNEFAYKVGDAVILCSERPFEDSGRIASMEVMEANDVLVKRKDGAFFNVPLAHLSIKKPRFDARHEADATNEISAQFLEYLQGRRYLEAHPETFRSVFDRAKPAFWGSLRRRFYEALVNSVHFGMLIDELDDVGQYHAFEPLKRCKRDFSSPICAEAEAVATSPPARTGAPRKGGTLLMSIRPIIPGTVIEVDGKQIQMQDGRASASFDADGAHRVIVKAPGRKAFDASSRVAKGETTTMPIVLLP